MDLPSLKSLIASPLRILANLDEAGVLPAPFELEALCSDDIDVVADLDTAADAGPCLYVDADVVADALVINRPVIVRGSVRARSITLAASMLVAGDLVVDNIRGAGDRDSLSVIGAVTIGTALMERQFIMQFVGGGTVGALIDTEGGADELRELLGPDLVVGRTGDEAP